MAASIVVPHPPGFRPRRGLNWAFIANANGSVVAINIETGTLVKTISANNDAFGDRRPELY